MSNTLQIIPQEAIDLLLEDPQYAPQFDNVFGQGQAQEVLRELAEAQATALIEEEDTIEGMPFMGKAWDATGKAVAHGAQEAVNETIDSAESLYEWGNRRIGGWLNEQGIPTHIDLWDDENQQLQFKLMTYEESLGQGFFLFGKNGVKEDGLELDLIAEPETVTGQVVSGISQFVTGFATVRGTGGLSGVKGALMDGAIVDAFMFDPNDDNLTAMLEDFGLDAPVITDLLATDPEDPEYINRLRNATEGAALGGIVEAIAWGVRARRAELNGEPIDGEAVAQAQRNALKELDKAIAEAGEAAKREIQENVDLSRVVFDENLVSTPRSPDEITEGQLRLDLGDAPLPAQASGETVDQVPNRIMITPERAEKARLQASLARGHDNLYKAQKTSFRSVTTVSSFDDVLSEIAGEAEVYADEFAKVKGGNTQSWASVKLSAAHKLREMARMTGENPEELIARFRSANSGDMTRLAAEIHAQSNYVLTLERELKEMAKAITTANSGGGFDPKQFADVKNLDDLKLQFNARREVATNLLASLDSNRSNVARALNAMKMAKEGDQRLREILKDPDAFKSVDVAARALADPANANEGTVKVMREAIDRAGDLMDDINTFRINALLSGPGTQEVNFVSNLVQMYLYPMEQAIGGLAKGDLTAARHAGDQFIGHMLGFVDSVKTSLDAAVKNDPILDFANKVEEEQFAKAQTALGSVVRLPSRGLMVMDEFFKQSQYRGVVFADANKLARDQGLKGEERTAFIKQYLAESYTDTGQATRGDALLQARRSTFTEELEGPLAVALQKAAIDQPIVRFVLPFVRTPINILSQTVQHLPILGAASRRLRDDLAAGGPRAAQALGKQIVGTGLAIISATMAGSGMITGSGPSDPRIRSEWMKNNKPYSFRLMNDDGTITFHSYARLEPLSNVFSIMADLREIMGDEYKEAERVPVAQAMVMAFMENTVNKTFTQGIYDFMSLLVGRPHEQERALNNAIASFVPNVFNQTNGDMALREVRDVMDAIMSRTARYNEVDVRRNILGEPVLRSLPKWEPLGLLHEDTRLFDPVIDQIVQQAMINQSISTAPRRTVPGPSRIDLSQVPYSETQSLYDKWLDETGTIRLNGRTLREELTRLIESNRYQKAPEGAYGVTRNTKGDMLRRVLSAYRKAAKNSIPELVEVFRAEKRGAGELLVEQHRANSDVLFPRVNHGSSGIRRPRNFEDLLKNVRKLELPAEE
ncbi:MAG: hypothetical protein AAFY35_04210 [Pseudomonadota bacterium]